MTQADHARFASDLLSLLRLPDLVAHPRRAALLKAVAAHDDGWWESDAAPRRSPADPAAPLDFRELPEGERAEVWRRGVERHAGSDPYVAAMIAAHGHRLLAARGGPAERRELVDDLAARRDALAEAAGLAGDELAADGAWLTLADELALAAATGDSRFVQQAQLRVEPEARPDLTVLRIAPFPFAGATTLALACRTIAREPAGSDAELARRLALAHWNRRPIRFAPQPGAATAR